MVQLNGTLAFMASFHVAANNGQFVTAIMCPIQRVTEVIDTLKNLGHYESIHDVYYHVKRSHHSK